MSSEANDDDPPFSIAGFLAGGAGVAAGQPFDTIKVRQQTLDRGATPILVAKHIISREGVLAFYKGMVFPMLSEGFRSGIGFGVYQKFKGSEDASVGRMLLSGAFGGIAQTPLGCAVELIKIQLQNQTGKDHSSRQFHSPVDCMKKLIQQHGSSVLLRGFYATLFRDITGWGVYMTMYDWACRKFHLDKNKPFTNLPELLLAGGVAGALSWMVNLPIDAVKSRQQSGPLDSPKTMRQCVSELMREGGLKSMYKGMSAAVVRAFLMNSVTLTLYTVFRSMLNKQDDTK